MEKYNFIDTYIKVGSSEWNLDDGTKILIISNINYRPEK